MKTKLTLFVTVLAAALFGMGCASSSLKEGLVAYYPFNGNVLDESGKGNHGAAKGVTLGTDRHGVSGIAYSFGGDDYILIRNTVAYTNKITVTAWIKIPKKEKKDSAPRDPWNNIICGPRGDIIFGIMGGSMTFGMQWADPFQITNDSSHVLNDNQWHQVAVSYNGEMVEFFVDGVFDGANAARGAFRPGIKSIGSAKPHANREFFIGSLDDIRIYNRALSAEEVKALYDLEKPKGK